MSAYAVLLFQKSNRRFGRRHILKELIDTQLPIREPAAVSAKLIIDVRLRNRKSGKLLCFRFFDMLYLFF